MRRVVLGAAVLVFVALLPSLADRLRGDRARCEFDGVHIDPAFRVRVVAGDGSDHHFCGVRCAREWVARQPDAPRRVRVTDWESGREIDAADAWFVRSFGSWTEKTPDAVRVFAKKAAAERHVERAGGRLLVGEERPFFPTGSTARRAGHEAG